MATTNILSIYDPIQYANLALIQLHKQLGMALRVHRGYDKTPQEKGSTIAIPIPSTFVAQDAPGPLTNINADSINITLNRWKEVKFSLTDKELNYTQEEIVAQHIVPATYAIADAIDQDLCQLVYGCPWATGTPGTTPSAVSDITTARKMLFNNKVPLVPGMIHLMIDGNTEANFLNLPAFTQNQGAGALGVESQLNGTLGTRYGMEIFANQNVQTHVAGTCSTTTLKLTNSLPVLSPLVNLSAVAVTGTLNVGDVIQIAGDPQNYAIVPPPGLEGGFGTAGAGASYQYTAVGNAFSGVYIMPHMKQDNDANAVVTVILQGGVRNLAFHRNFAALATAPLSDMANALGAKVGTVVDPVTGLSIRSRVWYSGDNSAIRVGLDVLYGVRVLDGNLANCMLG